MYKNPHNKQQQTIKFLDYSVPFNGKLDKTNRWIKLSKLIPWSKFEDLYSKQFSSGLGAGALSFRIALGALIIKERLGVTDREAVEQIKENPYLQYFLGFVEFKNKAPFDSSMYVHFRKRITAKILSEINEYTIADKQVNKSDLENKSKEGSKKDNDDNNKPSHNGKMMIDATCTPADIRYPVDISILNEARENTEKVIDCLYKYSKENKPRTYRKIARKEFLKVIRRRGKNLSRKGIRKQLNYTKRNLKYIENIKIHVPLTVLPKVLYRSLLVVSEVYRQQKTMFENNLHRIDNRIVSISQPHVRPIVRGKAGKKVEFGAKISASSCNGFTTVDRISWDAYNEGEDLIPQAEKYLKRFGYYPASIHADKIYINRKNRKWCKENNIRLSGIPLGRPPKVTNENVETIRKRKQLAKQDEIDRIDIEGRFGHSKRKYSLGRVMTKLKQTSESVISLVFLVMNLEKILKDIFLSLFSMRNYLLFNKKIYEIIERYIFSVKSSCIRICNA